MENGQAVASQLRPENAGGIPWMTIVDSDGTGLVTSDSPDGNIGCPVTESERAYFIEMLNTTKQRTSDDQIQFIADALADYAESLK